MRHELERRAVSNTSTNVTSPHAENRENHRHIPIRGITLTGYGAVGVIYMAAGIIERKWEGLGGAGILASAILFSVASKRN